MVRSGGAPQRFGTAGAVGKATRSALSGFPPEGVLGARVALAIRTADAADTAAASGSVRDYLAACKMLDDMLGKIGGAGGPVAGGAEPLAVEPSGLGDLLGTGPSVGDSSES